MLILVVIKFIFLKDFHAPPPRLKKTDIFLQQGSGLARALHL